MKKTYKFSELKKTSKENCIRLQKKYNFKKLTDKQIIEKIKKWDFVSNGEMYNGLTN